MGMELERACLVLLVLAGCSADALQCVRCEYTIVKGHL